MCAKNLLQHTPACRVLRACRHPNAKTLDPNPRRSAGPHIHQRLTGNLCPRIIEFGAAAADLGPGGARLPAE
jgi:hypothetical protein